MPNQTIAIIGASRDRSKYGNKAVRAFLKQGWQVYPVNPRGGEIEGQQAYKHLSEIPEDHLQRISMYVPPEVGLELLPEITEKGCEELWLNPGSESSQLIEEAESAGLHPIRACSILDIGRSPGEFMP
ncbi:CoA-binding domain protein [Planctomycetales bacterium 10988]|nr:CoA-binding domain protein [Planctomycetales bacterium 10988]